MAVQKSRKSKSKRNKRRNSRNSRNLFRIPTLSTDKETGEFHIRHFITKNGYYKGKQILKKQSKKLNKKNDIQ